MFVIQYASNETNGARLGMAVSTRAAGQAVNRNRLRDRSSAGIAAR